MKAGEKPILLVFNKIDLVETMPSEEESMQMTELELEEANYLDFESLSTAYEKNAGIKPVFMAAASGTNVEGFRESLIAEVKKQHRKIYPNYLEDEVYT
ncbi:MAG: GTP-binding protein HflX [Algoriphagus sp.]